VRRLLPLLALALALTAAPAAAAKAAAPCRDRVYNDWYADGKIATTYPLSCYRSALAHLNGSADLTIYSSLGDDIRLALAAAVRRQQHESAPREVGKGFTTATTSRAPASASSDPSAQTTTSASSALHSGRRPTPDSLDHTTAVADSSTTASAATGSSGGTPVPLLVLGGIALALVAAGAVGAGVRRKHRHDSG